MAVVKAFRALHPTDKAAASTNGSVNLCTSLTGNVDTTNTADRGAGNVGTGLIKITSTVGSTPTVTLNLQGSMDGTTWFNCAYATTAAPETPTVAALTITTATTSYYIIRPNMPWRYFKGVMSANTNVTLTIDIYFVAWAL